MSANVYALGIALFVWQIQSNLTDEDPSGICSTTRTGVECCTDYAKVGDKCRPCFGSFGPQCSRTCLPGFYGFGCKTKCTCDVCNRFNGSCLEGIMPTIYRSSTYKMSTDDQDIEYQYVWFLVGISSSSTFAIVVIVMLVLCGIKWHRKRRLSSANNHRGERKSVGTMNDVYEIMNGEKYI